MCDAFAKSLLAGPAAYYRLWSYIFDEDGNVRPEFLQATAAGGQTVLTPGLIIHDASTTSDEWVNGVGIKGRALCNGQLLDRDDYATLFAKIGTSFGPGDGVNTFAVPDLGGRTIIGVGDGTDAQPTPETLTFTFAQIVGEYKHTMLNSELPDLLFGNNVTEVFVKASNGSFTVAQTGSGIIHDVRTWPGADTPANNMQPSMALWTYVKT